MRKQIILVTVVYQHLCSFEYYGGWHINMLIFHWKVFIYIAIKCFTFIIIAYVTQNLLGFDCFQVNLFLGVQKKTILWYFWNRVLSHNKFECTRHSSRVRLEIWPSKVRLSSRLSLIEQNALQWFLLVTNRALQLWEVVMLVISPSIVLLEEEWHGWGFFSRRPDVDLIAACVFWCGQVCSVFLTIYIFSFICMRKYVLLT